MFETNSSSCHCLILSKTATLMFKKVRLGNFKSGEIGSTIFTWVCIFICITIGVIGKVTL